MKLTDVPELVRFLDDTMVATLAVPVDTAGTLHIATMHYMHHNDPINFYFVTQGTSEKCTLMNRVNGVRAACTVGTVPGVPFSLQMRGTASILQIADNQTVVDEYFDKRQSKNRNVEGDGAVIVRFTPDWARYTDYSKDWDMIMLDIA